MNMEETKVPPTGAAQPPTGACPRGDVRPGRSLVKDEKALDGVYTRMLRAVGVFPVRITPEILNSMGSSRV